MEFKLDFIDIYLISYALIFFIRELCYLDREMSLLEAVIEFPPA